MVKKVKKITKSQFRIGAIVIILLFIGLFYYGEIEDRFRVHETDGFYVGTTLLPPGETVSYKNEFCADKLTDLAHETHFLERDIKAEKKLMEEDGPILQDEINAIEIEQGIMNNLKEEFQKYKSMCDSFDQNPTETLCNQFVEEAKHNLELVQENAKAAESKGILERIRISFRELRQAERIYENLQAECIGVE